MNIYENNQQREKYLNEYFTKHGVDALETRLKSLLKVYVNNQHYPLTFRMYGFPTVNIDNKDVHKGMINNLKEILGVQEVLFRG